MLETEDSEQCEVSKEILLHKFTSLFLTLDKFNMNIWHCDIKYMTTNHEKHNTSHLKS